MTISTRLLNKAHNRCTIVPAWATLADWLEILATTPISTPLVDFGISSPYLHVGVTALNWYLLDLLGLRYKWYSEGWYLRDELWLLINPMRYRLLGHQPRHPYAYDVRDYLKKLCPYVLRETLAQHAYFAVAPTVLRNSVDDEEAERAAAQAPWSRIAVLDQNGHIAGMVWSPGRNEGGLPPILKPPYSHGSVTY